MPSCWSLLVADAMHVRNSPRSLASFGAHLGPNLWPSNFYLIFCIFWTSAGWVLWGKLYFFLIFALGWLQWPKPRQYGIIGSSWVIIKMTVICTPHIKLWGMVLTSRKVFWTCSCPFQICACFFQTQMYGAVWWQLCLDRSHMRPARHKQSFSGMPN